MKKKKSFANKSSVEPSKNHQKNSDKRKSKPDDSYEETGPSRKEMPVTGGPHHPHNEEILDGIPE